MMDSLRSSKLLSEYRGMKQVQKEELADMLLAVGRIALEFPMIREIDLNPVLIRDGKPTVADALIIL